MLLKLRPFVVSLRSCSSCPCKTARDLCASGNEVVIASNIVPGTCPRHAIPFIHNLSSKQGGPDRKHRADHDLQPHVQHGLTPSLRQMSASFIRARSRFKSWFVPLLKHAKISFASLPSCFVQATRDIHFRKVSHISLLIGISYGTER